MGQKRTHAPQQILFYHLVGELLEMQRYVEAEGFCGFEIDRQFKFGGLLYRHFRWQRSFQDTIDIDSRLTPLVHQVRPI